MGCVPHRQASGQAWKRVRLMTGLDSDDAWVLEERKLGGDVIIPSLCFWSSLIGLRTRSNLRGLTKYTATGEVPPGPIGGNFNGILENVHFTANELLVRPLFLLVKLLAINFHLQNC